MDSEKETREKAVETSVPVAVEPEAHIEVVEHEPIALVITDRFLKDFERQVHNFSRYLTLTLKLTNEEDWINFGGKYYLQATGLEKVATPLGVVWNRPQVWKEDSEDGNYTFCVEGISESRALKRFVWAYGY